MRFWIIGFCMVLCGVSSAAAERASYVDLARQGWSYQLRTTMVGRDMSIPVQINGRDLAGANLCIIGDVPHPSSLETINAFRALESHVFGKPTPMRYAGRHASNCGSGRTIILRLYSGHPPNRALSTDLNWLNEAYLLGLPASRYYAASSPAMAQTFFGRRGNAVHIMVKQPAQGRPGRLEAAFYKSILVEELFQSFTFGMDILLFDRSAAFYSKLQETPFRLRRQSWESSDFMRSLLKSNPAGLCAFDVFMMHAIAQSTVEQTNDPGFIDYIEGAYDGLRAQADVTMRDDRFASILAPDCKPSAIRG